MEKARAVVGKVREFITFCKERRAKTATVICFIILASSSFYFWNKARLLANSLPEAERARIVKELSKFMILPEGEQPSVATVTDPEQLKGQPFFDKAKKGDKVIIYSGTRKAILYSPDSKKIIEFTILSPEGNPQ